VPYTFPEFSGSGLNAFRFARYLINSGKKATVLSFNRNNKHKHYDLTDKVPVRRILYFNRNLLLKLLSLTWIIPAYMIQVSRHDTISLYGNRIIGYEFVVIFARLIGKKIVFQSLLAEVDDPDSIVVSPGGRVKSCSRFILSLISCYHSINSKFTGQYRKAFPGKENWIQCPQGVDSDKFCPIGEHEKKSLRAKMGIPEDKFIILSVGSVIERKRFGFLTDILSGLEFPFLFVMAGEFEYDKDHFLKNELAKGRVLLTDGQKKLGDKLYVAGPSHNIEDYYNIADIYIHAALREGLPNTIIEAMASGLPVISSKIPGLDDFVLFNDANCLTAGSKEEFVRHIINLKEDKELFNRIGTRGREFIEQNATFEKVMDALEMKLTKGNEL